jgi:ribokinase
VGDDELAGRAEAELRRQGITTHLARRPGPTRQAITLFDPAGERSIITVGERLQPAGDDPLPWDELKQADGDYFTAGDLAALRSARQAAILATTPRISERLIDPNVPLDALIYSADDRQEQAWAQQLKPLSRYVVETDGARGGRWSGKTSGAWEPARPPGPVIDTYGAGDSFAGGFTLGLASTGDPAQASRAGAAAAALMLTRAGAP